MELNFGMFCKTGMISLLLFTQAAHELLYLGYEAKNISNDAHRWGWRVNVCVAHHELLKDIILNSAGQLSRFNALNTKLQYALFLYNQVH